MRFGFPYYHQSRAAVRGFSWLPMLLGLGLVASPAAAADDEAQLAAIRHLGDLNAVALHCKALLETQRMKRALVATLPKRRALGELFDDQTNKSFMKFIQDKAHCPSPADLIEQIDQGIAVLEQVWANTQPVTKAAAKPAAKPATGAQE